MFHGIWDSVASALWSQPVPEEAPQGFSPFARLPSELRQQIWETAALGHTDDVIALSLAYRLTPSTHHCFQPGSDDAHYCGRVGEPGACTESPRGRGVQVLALDRGCLLEPDTKCMPSWTSTVPASKSVGPRGMPRDRARVLAALSRACRESRRAVEAAFPARLRLRLAPVPGAPPDAPRVWRDSVVLRWNPGLDCLFFTNLLLVASDRSPVTSDWSPIASDRSPDDGSFANLMHTLSQAKHIIAPPYHLQDFADCLASWFRPRDRDIQASHDESRLAALLLFMPALERLDLTPQPEFLWHILCNPQRRRVWLRNVSSLSNAHLSYLTYATLKKGDSAVSSWQRLMLLTHLKLQGVPAALRSHLTRFAGRACKDRTPDWLAADFPSQAGPSRRWLATETSTSPPGAASGMRVWPAPRPAPSIGYYANGFEPDQAVTIMEQAITHSRLMLLASAAPSTSSRR